MTTASNATPQLGTGGRDRGSADEGVDPFDAAASGTGVAAQVDRALTSEVTQGGHGDLSTRVSVEHETGRPAAGETDQSRSARDLTENGWFTLVMANLFRTVVSHVAGVRGQVMDG
jgi:hypothetical protein